MAKQKKDINTVPGQEIKQLRRKSMLISFIPIAVLIISGLVMRYTTSRPMFLVSAVILTLGIWFIAGVTVYSNVRNREAPVLTRALMCAIWIFLVIVFTFGVLTYFFPGLADLVPFSLRSVIG